MDDLYLGIDVGTQGTKGVLLSGDPRRGVVATANSSYGLIEGLPPGAAEQDPQVWRDAVRDVVARLLAAPGVKASALRALAVSGQQHGLVALDADGRVVRPAKLWCDTEAAAEARVLSSALGRRVPAGFTAPKVLWMQRTEPERWARVRAVLLPHDYLNLLLTGRAWCEAGDASGTGWFDPAARRLDRAATALLGEGFAAMVPPLLASDALGGRVSAEAAGIFGIPEGVAVATGSGDNMMSALGSGASREGRLVVSLGTSATAFAASPRPIVDPEGLVAAFCDATGAWLPLLCVMNATGVTEEVRAAFGGDHETLTREAEAVPAGAEGLLFLPYLQGERVPDLPEATGALLGIRPQRLSRGHLFRAAIEGATLSLAAGVLRLRALGLAVSEVHLVGGGSRNRLWCQVLADALDLPVRRLLVADAAALGAAIQAQWALRRAQGEDVAADLVAAPYVRAEDAAFLPDPARAALYRERRLELESATRRLFGGG